ncbi:hypothetical protein EDC94DRAFT_589198 [Helicostylum pulchrum]|nr:hypothetical protein EDC94DRAFT_589198 [Helicostylum pulchrum]
MSAKKLHASLADGILEAVGVSGHEDDNGNESDDSCTLEKYHPKRSRKYSVTVSNDDDNQSVSNNHAVITNAVEISTAAFKGLDIKKSRVHEFMKEEYNISLKVATSHPTSVTMRVLTSVS